VPRLLDLFCCAGGGAVGYARAGWEVVGVDIEPRPSYPFEFIQADALEVLSSSWFVDRFDAIHASPPCQIHSAPTKGTNKDRPHNHVDLIGPTREFLQRYDIPWVIENVQGAPVRKDITLCGEMFGLGVLMHRYFELGNWTTDKPTHVPHRGRVRGWRHGVYYDGPYVAAYGEGGGKATVEEIQVAKQIDWIDDHFELREALPPAYGHWLGTCLDMHLNAFS
jgi:hypothetical protein